MNDERATETNASTACQLAGATASPRQRRRRRTPGEGGLRQRSAGTWELKFDVGHDPATGKRLTRFVTVRAKDKKEALQKLGELRDQAGKGTLVDPSKLTLGDFLEQWLVEHAANRPLRAKTRERYAEIVRKHLVPHLGAHRISKLTAAHLQTYYHAALTTPRKRKKRDGSIVEGTPLSRQTVKHHHRVLSQALKHAERQRLIARNPASDIDAPRPERREMQILTQTQTAALLHAAEGSAIYVPIVLGVMAGLRRGEILGARWSDVDLDARTLAVAQTLEQTERPRSAAKPATGTRPTMAARGLGFERPKTDKSRRVIALPALAAEALRRHQVRQKEARLAAGKAYADHDLVVADALGDPLEPHYVSQAFAKLAKAHGLKGRFHDLRHTHVSQLLAAGEPVSVVAARVGHASAKMTLDVYGHVIPGAERAAADRFDAALRGCME